jgi:hypothetical protein
MENISGKNISKLLFKSDLIKIGDLQFYEGSLMTLFENTKKLQLYLFDWVDGDTQFNRWLVYLVSPEDIISYLDLQITHLNLIKTSAEIYVLDIDKHYNYHNVKALDFNQIIDDYLPQEESLFDVSDCRDVERIESKLAFLIKRKYNTHSLNYAMASEPGTPIYGSSSALQ